MVEFVQMGVGQADIERLTAQAAALEAVDHPGVVEFLRFSAIDGVAELVTVEVEGRSLAAYPDMGPSELAGIAAAVSTTLADLHDAGLVHGGVSARHILLSADGPVLCGLRPERTPEDDVHDLGVLLADRVDAGPLAEVAAGACHPDPACRPTARALAASLHARIDGAHLPGSPPPALASAPTLDALLSRPGGRPRRRGRRVAIPVVAVVAVLAFTALRPATDSTPAVAVVRAPRPSPTTTAAPAVETSLPTQVWPVPAAAGPAPTLEIGGRRYAVGQPGDLAVADVPGCGNTPRVAVLRPATGTVYIFAAIADAGHDSSAVPIGTVAGASALAFRDADDDGCNEIVVTRSQGDPVVLSSETA